MDADESLNIGQFARLTGLSVHALRHYDDVGLLAPAMVDPNTGYRRYQREQIAAARLISRLRWIDLPIQEIRALLGEDRPATLVAETLQAHRRRLERARRLTDDRLRDLDRILQRGLIVNAPTARIRPVQIKLGVDDVDDAVAFYSKAFGMRYEAIRRADEQEYSALVLGDYSSSDFFLVVLMGPERDDIDRPSTASTVGLLVDDLDAVHDGALDAGGVELVAPHQPEGMPRCSAVGDPSGNWVWLYQG